MYSNNRPTPINSLSGELCSAIIGLQAANNGEENVDLTEAQKIVQENEVLRGNIHKFIFLNSNT